MIPLNLTQCIVVLDRQRHRVRKTNQVAGNISRD